MIINTLICGSSSQQVQSMLLEHKETLTLNTAIGNIVIVRTEEATSSQLQDIKRTTTISTLRRKNSRRPPAKPV